MDGFVFFGWVRRKMHPALPPECHDSDQPLLAVILSEAKNLIQYAVSAATTSKCPRRVDRDAGAWMRFFAAKSAPQNDDGWVVE
ncbi:MAG TPA: hypothetical protein VGD60_15310 [Candidatus Acidoferrales bacterium]